MSHLGDHITDYVFEELSAAEMAEARAHVAKCGECRVAVEHFQRTRSLLKSVPDFDPPRSSALVFERPVRRWTWRWLVPMATAAVLLIVVAMAAPIHVQWQDSQLTIAFGASVEQPSAAEQQTSLEIQELRSQIAGLANLNEQQRRMIYEWGSAVQKLAGERSAGSGD